VGIKHNEDENMYRIYVKGAPEYIVPNCNTFYDVDGQKVELTAESRLDLT